MALKHLQATETSREETSLHTEPAPRIGSNSASFLLLRMAIVGVFLILAPWNKASAQYCTTGAYGSGCIYDDYINSFSTTGGTTNITNNSSACGSTSVDGYQFYSTMTHTTTPGSVVSFSFTNNPTWGEGYKIWVDYNGNGLFTDAGEQVYASTATISGGTTVTGSFTVPLTASVGTTRIRIRCVYASTTFTPCDYQSYGEIEDYNFAILSGCTGSPNAPTITTSAITTPICPATTATIAASNPSPPAGILYQWEQATTSTGPWTSVTGGTGGTTLTYTTAALAATTWFRVKATCGVNNAPSAAFQVPVAVAPPQPGTITGGAAVCTGTSQTYSVAAVTGAVSYTWTTPTGWTGTSTTNTLVATAGGAGNITVKATGACGLIGPVQTFAVTTTATPAQPGAITGNTSTCPTLPQPYSITSVAGATSYTWTLPAASWSGTSTTNSINTTAGTTGGAITVTASNTCGTSPASTLAVAVTNQAPTLAAITGNNSVCSGSAQTYSVPAVSGVVYYVWTLPGSWSGVSTSNSIPVTIGSGSGNVTVAANNGCGTSAAQSMAVTVNPQVVPAVTITSTSNSICAGAPVTFNATTVNGGSAPSYQWKKNGINVGINTPSYTPVSILNGDVVTLVMTGNAQCASTPTSTSNAVSIGVNPNIVPGINVNATTPQAICSGTAVTFYSNITGGGTAPVYKWIKNGTSVGGNTPTYTDATLASGDSVSCVLTTNATCATTPTASSNKLTMNVLPILTPVATVTAYPGNMIAEGQQVIFSAAVTNGGNNPTYQWIRNGANINGETGATYTTSTLKNGDQVSVQLTSTAPCTSAPIVGSNKVTVYYTTGIATVNAGDIKLSIAPNPNSGHFTLTAEWDNSSAGKRVRIEVLNTLGQMVYFTEVVPGRGLWHMDINLNDGIANGLYMVRLTTDGKQLMKRFEINR